MFNSVLLRYVDCEHNGPYAVTTLVANSLFSTQTPAMKTPGRMPLRQASLLRVLER